MMPLIFTILRDFFYSVCSILHSHQHCLSIPVSPHLQHLLGSIPLISHSMGCQVISLWFWFAFTLRIIILNIFCELLRILYLFWRYVYLDPLLNFKLYCFLILSYKSLYILSSTLLSAKCCTYFFLLFSGLSFHFLDHL